MSNLISCQSNCDKYFKMWYVLYLHFGIIYICKLVVVQTAIESHTNLVY